jgi:very-short-patch-repair endonuclease
MSDQRSDRPERLHANPSRMEQELAIKLQDNGIHYQTQIEIPATLADFSSTQEPRTVQVFIDGHVHLRTSQTAKDEKLRSLLRKRGYRILELRYTNYSDKVRDLLYEEIIRDIRGRG